MKYSSDMEVLQMMADALRKTNQDVINRIEYYIYGMYYTCYMIEKGEIEPTEELKLLHQRVKQQVKELDVWVENLGMCIYDNEFIPYLFI